MRVPVYPRGADPRVDRFILKKSLAYAEEQVRNLLADWIDDADPSKGIVACEFLPSGKAFAPETSALATLKTRFVANCRFRQPDQPTHYGNDQIAAVRILPKSVVLPSWDWSQEPALEPAIA